MRMTILEQFDVEVADPVPGDSPWFLDWALKSPAHVGEHLARLYHSYLAIFDAGVEVDVALEYFGGLGATSLVMEDLFDPSHQRVNEYSPEAVAHLQALSKRWQVRNVDSYDESSFYPADVVGLDFPNFTVWSTREGQPARGLLDQVFNGRPEAVVITDVGCPRMHLQRERYEALLGKGACDNPKTYAEALAARFEDIYGYPLLTGFYDRWSSVFAFTRRGPQGALEPSRKSPVGIQVYQ